MTQKPETTREKVKLALIFLPGFLAAMALFGENFLVPNPGFVLRFNVIVLGLAGVCIGGIFASFNSWRTVRILIPAALAVYWAMVGGLFFFVLLNPIFALLYYGVFLIPLFVVVGLCTAGARTNFDSRWIFRSAAAGFVCGLSMVIVVSAPALKRTADRNAPWTRPPDPNIVGQEIVTVAKCTQEFKSSHPEAGYPESLRQLGPDGTGCLPEALLNESYKGFSLSYHAGTKDTSGRIVSFAMHGEQTAPHGPDFSIISTDESGLVRYSYEGPHGKGIPLSYSPSADTITQITGCIRNASNDHRTDRNQADLAVQQCLGDKATLIGRRGNLGLLDFDYTFELDDLGAIDGFTADVRPSTYGVGGVRSYIIVDRFPAGDARTFRAYATAEDRPATPFDPPAMWCEIANGACVKPAEIN